MEKKSGEGDYLRQVFNNIKWESRVKPENRRKGFTKEVWESTHTYKYLWYKLEPERIDLNNPFDIEEGNHLRRQLPMKRKVRAKRKEGTTIDLMSEQVREVKKDGEEQDADAEEDEDDFLDEFGNVIPDALREIQKSEKKQRKAEQSKMKEKNKVTVKAVNIEEAPKEKKKRKRFDAKKVEIPSKRRWQDMDGDNQGDHNKKSKFNGLGFEFPRLSSLSCWQQDKFLNLQMIINKGGKLSSVDEKVYLQLLSLVQQERAEFTKFSKELCEQEKEVYEKIVPDLDKYVTEHREKRKTRVLQYPRFWKHVKDARLSAARTEQGTLDKFYLQPAECILEKGVIPLASIPNKHNQQMLPKTYNRIVHKYPADPNIKPGSQGISRGAERNLRTGMGANAEVASFQQPEIVPINEYIHNVSAMEDKNASKIAAVYLPDVIISASGLKCIMDNFYPSFGRSWEIPVFVQAYASDDMKSKRSVIFIGKPFLSRQVSATDRNKVAYKYSARTVLTKDWGTKGGAKSDMVGNHKNPNVRVEAISDLFKAQAEDDLFDANLEDFESFGESSVTSFKPSSTLGQKLSKSADKTDKADDSNTQQPSVSKSRDGVLQVDGTTSSLSGTLSAMSFQDLEMPTLSQTDLRIYADAIVFDPDQVDANLGELRSFGDCEPTVTSSNISTSSDQKLSKRKEIREKADDSNFQPTGSKPHDDGRASSISADLSFPDLEMTTFTQGDLHNCDLALFDDKWLSQLDGAVSSLSSDEDDELTIDLGPNSTSADGKESTVADTNKDVTKENDESEKDTSKGRRSMRLRLQSGNKHPTPKKGKKGKEEKTKTRPNQNSSIESDENVVKQEIGTKKVKEEKISSPNQNSSIESDESTAKQQSATKKVKEEKIPSPNENQNSSIESDESTVKQQSVTKKMKQEIGYKDKDKQKQENKKKDNHSNNQQNLGILDSLLTGQSALLSKQQTSNRHKKEKKVYKGEEMNFASGHLGSADQYLPPLPGTNYSYRLWNLWNENKQNSNIRIVIRSKVACFCPYSGAIVPSVKLEYQKLLGAEQCTVSECCREWIDNIIRPDATTVRLRIEASSGQVLHTQRLDLNKIKEEGAGEHSQHGDEGPAPDRFDPSLQLANLHNLISDLRGIAPGTYLLSHDRKSGPFCRLYQQSDKGNSDFDLHESYAYVDPAYTTPNIKVPWRQIDYNCITPYNLQKRRVPGTFEPYDRK